MLHWNSLCYIICNLQCKSCWRKLFFPFSITPVSTTVIRASQLPASITINMYNHKYPCINGSPHLLTQCWFPVDKKKESYSLYFYMYYWPFCQISKDFFPHKFSVYARHTVFTSFSMRSALTFKLHYDVCVRVCVWMFICRDYIVQQDSVMHTERSMSKNWAVLHACLVSCESLVPKWAISISNRKWLTLPVKTTVFRDNYWMLTHWVAIADYILTTNNIKKSIWFH